MPEAITIYDYRPHRKLYSEENGLTSRNLVEIKRCAKIMHDIPVYLCI